MDRDVLRGIALLMCFVGAVAPDIEHLTSILFGTAWGYGLHSEVAFHTVLLLSLASFIGLVTKYILRYLTR